MGVGSVVGGIAGGLLVALFPGPAVMALLGLLLTASALRAFSPREVGLLGPMRLGEEVRRMSNCMIRTSGK